MPVTDPLSPAFALVYSTLHGDSTLMSQISGVYQDIGPAVAYSKPYCIFQLQSAVDTNTATAVRMLTRLILTVKIIGQAADGPAIRSAFARVDTLLVPGGQPTRLAGGTLALYRTGIISYSELASGIQYVHLGGLYRAEV